VKLAVLIGISVLAALAAAQGTATVDGVVVNKVTGAGIEGVTVWLWSSDTNSSKVVTNEAGIFHFSGLTPGDYISRMEKSGYSDPTQEVLVLPGDSRPRRPIVVGGEPVHLRFELIPPAVLRGRVIGADGNPATSVVELGRGRTANTNAEGVFVFENVLPGSYTLLARPKVTGHLSGKDEIRTEPVPTYYPSVVEGSLAETIMVRPGAELTGYEIRLQSAEVHRVHGVVLDPDGKPAAKATVALQPRTPAGGMGMTFHVAGTGGVTLSVRNSLGGGQPEEQVVTAADGRFEFPAVRVGEWMIQARSDWIRDEIQHRNILRSGSAVFRVERDDPEELKIQFATPFNLSLPTSIVLSDGSPPAPGVSVSVSLFSETGPGARIVKVDSGRVLQLNDVIPGTYEIRADVAAGNYYTESIFLGTTNVMGQRVELTSIPMPLKIVLKPAGTLRGIIEDADAGTILLFPESFSGAGYSVQSGSGRTFEIDGVAPGAYYAIALDRLDLPAIADAVRLRGLMSKATSVRVDAGSAASVQLRLNHIPD
jgi:hypothetical protein